MASCRSTLDHITNPLSVAAQSSSIRLFSHVLCLLWVCLYLRVCVPTLWQIAHLPACSGSTPIRCCSFPGCEGHGNGSSQNCVPEMRPLRFGPVCCASAAQSGETSTGSALPEVRDTNGSVLDTDSLTAKSELQFSNSLGCMYFILIFPGGNLLQLFLPFILELWLMVISRNL